MSIRYALPCDACGRRHPVETSQAGGQVNCECGATIRIPTMLKIKRLEPWEDADAETDRESQEVAVAQEISVESRSDAETSATPETAAKSEKTSELAKPRKLSARRRGLFIVASLAFVVSVFFCARAIKTPPPIAVFYKQTVYDLGDGTVAKIYHRGKLTVGRREKLERMTAEPVCCEGVCWPKELLRDAEGNFVGYRMERARGTELQRALFTRPALEAHFPDWKKADMVQLCITILEKICALHERGIILGDINPLNILVVSPTEVWFVDCDSYQIGGYPCPVGTVRFTAPEIQKRNFADFLRTEGNEAFAVATLLFMLMLPGKSPYAQEGGGDLSEAILAMDFPYPCGDNHSDKTPEGAWRFLWSHLPRYLKEYFYGTFQNGGAYSTEQTRRTTQQWLTAFRYYLRLLQEGKLQDPESAEIFPTRWKVTDPAARTVWERRTCAECGNAFDIMESERDYYREKGMFLPRRCPTCRRLRRKLGSMSFSGSMEL